MLYQQTQGGRTLQGVIAGTQGEKRTVERPSRRVSSPENEVKGAIVLKETRKE